MIPEVATDNRSFTSFGSRKSTDFMHARYFSSNLGRFLSVDPVGGEVGSSQSWNRYSYALNNPLVLVDPTGMKEERKFWRRVWDRIVSGLAPKAPVSEEEREARVNALLEGAGIDPEEGLNSIGTGAAENIADGARDAIATVGAEVSEEAATVLALGAFSRVKPVGEWLPGRLRRSKSYHSEYAKYSVEALREMKNDPKAKQMLKLALQAKRLMEKVGGK